MKPINIWLSPELDRDSLRITSEISEKAEAVHIEIEYVQTFDLADFAIFRASTLHVPLQNKVIFFTERPLERVRVEHIVSDECGIADEILKALLLFDFHRRELLSA